MSAQFSAASNADYRLEVDDYGGHGLALGVVRSPVLLLRAPNVAVDNIHYHPLACLAGAADEDTDGLSVGAPWVAIQAMLRSPCALEVHVGTTYS